MKNGVLVDAFACPVGLEDCREEVCYGKVSSSISGCSAAGRCLCEAWRRTSKSCTADHISKDGEGCAAILETA
jgi:hypothetical protein